jgi:maleate cis-trans isomerase
MRANLCLICVCDGLQNGMDLGETVPSVCSETGLTLSANRSEVSDVRAEEVLHMQEEEDRLAVALPAVKAVDTVCYVCNIVLLTVVQACTVASAFCQCVVWRLGVTSQ